MKIHFSYICENAPAIFKDSKTFYPDMTAQ